MNKISKKKLKEAKTRLSCIIFDYDGTLFDRFDKNFNHNRARKLLLKSLNKYHVAVITARSASALKSIAAPMLKIFSKKRFTNRFFLGVGNGVTLYEIKKNQLDKIYSHELSFSDIKFITKIYKQILKRLGLARKAFNSKGLEIFSKFVLQNWGEYIPNNIGELNKSWGGMIFAEQAKVSIVKPLNLSKEKQLVSELRKLLFNNFDVVVGDIDIHIIKRLSEDSKKKAAKTIIKKLRISPANVVTFGDLPSGNDKALLSFPLSFTNDSDIKRKQSYLDKPPYVLSSKTVSPVGTIYKAVDYLIKS